MLSAASVKKQTLCATVIRIPLVHDNASGLRGDGFTESAGALLAWLKSLCSTSSPHLLLFILYTVAESFSLHLTDRCLLPIFSLEWSSWFIQSLQHHIAAVVRLLRHPISQLSTVVQIVTIFCLRDAMLARVLAVALCLSVCVSVCHKSEFYRNGWTNRSGFGHGSFLPPILHCINRKFEYLQK